jgi:hypothetical protein
VRTETRALSLRYLPYLGGEFERPFNTSKASLATQRDARTVWRALASVQTQWYPFPKDMDYRLQLTADYNYRRGSVAETTERVRDHRRFDAAANYFLIKQSREEDPKRSAGLTLTYTKGVDSSNGLERIEVTKFGFSILF